jgi:hypothetical protein
MDIRHRKHPPRHPRCAEQGGSRVRRVFLVLALVCSGVIATQIGTANAALTTLSEGRGVWAIGDQTLASGSMWQSRGYDLVMQTDGNLVLYDWWLNPPYGTAIWNSGTYGNPGAVMKFQTDGNLVVYLGSTRSGTQAPTAIQEAL